MFPGLKNVYFPEKGYFLVSGNIFLQDWIVLFGADSFFNQPCPAISIPEKFLQMLPTSFTKQQIICKISLKMLKTLLLLLTLILFWIPAASQDFTLRGKVTDASSGKPIAHASVYLSNTSYGTQSNESGEFTLPGINNGRYDLVVSYVGYEIFEETISGGESVGSLKITLKPAENELREVIVKSYDPDGWKKWGQFFLDNFIGTMAGASTCVLKNPEAVKFHFSKTANKLSAFANDPLIIENPALGYIIHYQLQTFEYSYATGNLYYAGFPFFEEMAGNRAHKKRWEAARKADYTLSFMRFLRSLYRNRLLQDGYQLFRLEKKPNLEKERLINASKLFEKEKTEKQNRDPKFQFAFPPADSLTYYNSVMREPDPIELTYPQQLTGDSIAFAEDSLTAVLDFSNYLIIRLPNITVPPEYAASDININPRQPVSSELYLANNLPVRVTASGYFYEVQDLLMEGFWGWWEKLGTILPFNYTP